MKLQFIYFDTSDDTIREWNALQTAEALWVQKVHSAIAGIFYSNFWVIIKWVD